MPMAPGADKLVEALKTAKSIYILTGAGLGVASGLDTFRGAGGMWKDTKVSNLASRSYFNIDPHKVWEWYNMRISAYNKATPNAAHTSIAELQKRLPITLATQNVDSLHYRAGSEVLELHGNLRTVRCTGCDYRYELEGTFDLDNLRHGACGAYLRPNIVRFGDDLPEDVYKKAYIAGEDADVVIVAGTSGLVYPAMTTVEVSEGQIFEINPMPVLGIKADYRIPLGTEIVFPYLLENL